MQILFIKNNELVEFNPINVVEVDAYMTLIDSLGEMFGVARAHGVVALDIDDNEDEPDLPIMGSYLLVIHLLNELALADKLGGERSRIERALRYVKAAYETFKARVEQRPSEA